MTDQCATELGPVGCWYQMFPLVAAMESPAPAPAGPMMPPAPDLGSAGGGRHPPLGPLLGGLLGGVALLAAASTALAVCVIRIRRRHLQALQYSDSKTVTSEERARAALAVAPPADTAFCNEDVEGGGGMPPRGSSAASANRMADPDPSIVTERTPLHPNIRLDVDLAGQEVTLLPVTRGKGAYGRIVEGMYGGQRVAVKLLDWGLAGTPQPDGGGAGREGDGGAEGAGAETEWSHLEAALAQEVAVLGRCSHPNIVRLLAASLRPPRVCLVMELLDTSLDSLIHGTDRRVPLLPLPKVLHIAIQVAQGLEYLHPTILHRDLKPANVLISNPDSPQPVVKLADFGLSRLRDSVLVTRHPEAGTDVYACGTMCYEMLSGSHPWSGFGTVQVACAITLRGERPPLHAISDERCPPKLRSLIQDCWETDPQRRPAAAEVVKMLTLVQQALARGPLAS
ncbi:putative serine/threonine-protein kinase [Tetrabaena socialis]|uniref:Putative serine/threonine-protein kinase n=1 Tax=Tetrabaena socialis TaxID=47790 RepID=A0A2J8AI62_9CHLO|nr:putative serine/threonine-protein kinase [Tetrabaena socialis]|eukprot:PNH12208.1 putative serine/threonine-protein kinase [Tetrabaena socialis]